MLVLGQKKAWMTSRGRTQHLLPVDEGWVLLRLA